LSQLFFYEIFSLIGFFLFVCGLNDKNQTNPFSLVCSLTKQHFVAGHLKSLNKGRQKNKKKQLASLERKMVCIENRLIRWEKRTGVGIAA
jgi:hypothetical protein